MRDDELAADATAVDDGDRREVGGRVAVDAVAGEAGDLLDGGVERRERAQRAVAEPVAGAPAASTACTSGTASSVSSDREMPTVTVLA